MRWVAALLLCLAPALSACGASPASTLPAWRGLAGQRVGSRVLLVIPPGLGYGKPGNPPLIRGTDTLVYVVDIIAAIHG